jgi:hypothetical protein
MGSSPGPWDPLPGVTDLVALNEAMQQAAAALQVNQDLAQRALDAITGRHDLWRTGVDAMQEAVRGLLPDNWHGLRNPELDVIDVIRESGLCLVWAPRAELVDALVGEDDPSRRLLHLVAERQMVLDDLEAVLARAAGVPVTGHAEASAFAREAIAAARDGHLHAAQALAACGLGTVLEEIFGYPRLREAYEKFEVSDVERAGMTSLKLRLLEVCTAKALTNTRAASSAVFNRHGTQHGLRAFFSAANAMGGMLLLVGWLRELKWFDEHYEDVFSEFEDENLLGH